MLANRIFFITKDQIRFEIRCSTDVELMSPTLGRYRKHSLNIEHYHDLTEIKQEFFLAVKLKSVTHQSRNGDMHGY